MPEALFARAQCITEKGFWLALSKAAKKLTALNQASTI